MGTHGHQLLLDRPRLRFEGESRARVCGRGGLRLSAAAQRCGAACVVGASASRLEPADTRAPRRGVATAATRGPSAASRSTTRSRSARIVAMWASWPTTPSTVTTTPFIRALSPTTWRSWLERYRPTGDGQRERRTWYRHWGATAICSRRSASWPLAGSDEGLLTWARTLNREFSVPLPDSEVWGIWRSVCRYRGTLARPGASAGLALPAGGARAALWRGASRLDTARA